MAVVPSVTTSLMVAGGAALAGGSAVALAEGVSDYSVDGGAVAFTGGGASDYSAEAEALDAFTATSDSGNNTTTRGSYDDGAGGWSAEVDVNWGTDMRITGMSTPVGSTAHIAKNDGDFTDLSLHSHGVGGLSGALHGLHTVTHTDGRGNTWTAKASHQAQIHGRMTADGWEASLEVPFGPDTQISARAEGDRTVIDIDRNMNTNQRIEVSGDASLQQQFATAVALAVHN